MVNVKTGHKDFPKAELLQACRTHGDTKWMARAVEEEDGTARHFFAGMALPLN